MLANDIEGSVSELGPIERPHCTPKPKRPQKINHMKLNSMENFGPLLIIDDSRRERKEEKWV